MLVEAAAHEHVIAGNARERNEGSENIASFNGSEIFKRGEMNFEFRAQRSNNGRPARLDLLGEESRNDLTRPTTP